MFSILWCAFALAASSDPYQWLEDVDRTAKKLFAESSDCVQFARTVDAKTVHALGLEVVWKNPGRPPQVRPIYQSYMETWIGECLAKRVRQATWPTPPTSPIAVLLTGKITSFKLSLAEDASFAPPVPSSLDSSAALPLTLVRRIVVATAANIGPRCLQARAKVVGEDLRARLTFTAKLDEAGFFDVTSTGGTRDETLAECAVSVLGAAPFPAGYGGTKWLQIEVIAEAEGGAYAKASEESWSWKTLTSVRFESVVGGLPLINDPYLWLYNADRAIAQQLPEIDGCFVTAGKRDRRIEALLVSSTDGKPVVAVAGLADDEVALSCLRGVLAGTALARADDAFALRFTIEGFGSEKPLVSHLRYAEAADFTERMPAELAQPERLSKCQPTAEAAVLSRWPEQLSTVKPLGTGVFDYQERGCLAAASGAGQAVGDKEVATATVFTTASANNPLLTPPFPGPVQWLGAPDARAGRRMVVGNYPLDEVVTTVPSVAAQVLQCVQRTKGAPANVSGDISVLIDLDGTGKISSVKAVTSSVPLVVVGCVEEEIRRVQFLQPPDGKPSTFVWTWAL